MELATRTMLLRQARENGTEQKTALAWAAQLYLQDETWVEYEGNLEFLPEELKREVMATQSRRSGYQNKGKESL